MKLSLHHTIKPFSHQMGQIVLFPKTSLSVQIFPNLIWIRDLEDKTFEMKIELDILDFIENFTIEVNYQGAFIRVFGSSKEGFLEYKLTKTEDHLKWCLKRFNKELIIWVNQKKHTLTKGQELILIPLKQDVAPVIEHLYLGVSKQQDMDLMLKRMDLQELLPFVFAFGQRFESTKKVKPLTLDEIKKILISKTVGFLVPTLKNPLHIQMDLTTDFSNETQVLGYLYQDMKNRLVQENKNTLSIFFDMFKKFVSGKALNIQFSSGVIHIEWTKGFLRQVILVLNTERKLNIEFPKNVKSFRLQKDQQVIGIETIKEPGIYHFDRFLA